MVAVVEDITSDQEALEQQKREAELDPLTGLLNRRGGDRRLRLALDQMAQHGPLAVIVTDADGFKEINDRFGHAAGDEVLSGIAGRLRSAIRHGDDVARLGGDEFIIVARVADEAEAQTIASRCVNTMAEPIRASRAGGPQRVTLSAGLAVAYPGQSVSADLLLDSADQALYRAKAEGGNCWVMAEVAAGRP
jgi:diguanylate cyclase (GGDEF)-like protein